MSPDPSDAACLLSLKRLDAQIAGTDLDATRALLIEIDARRSMKTNKEMWSLIARNPLPNTSED